MSKQNSNEPFHYRNRNLVVGFFVLLPFFVVSALLIATVVRSDLLESWITVNLKCESGTGLIKGRTPVKVMGIYVGNVKKVEINRSGYVDVSIRIKEKFEDFIRTNSDARLSQKNIVVGDWEIDISSGTFDRPYISDGDTLNVVYPIRLDDFMELTTGFMGPLQDIVTSLNSGEGLIKYILGSEDTLMPGIYSLIEEVEQLFYKAGNTLTKADDMLSDFSKFGNHGVNMVDSLMIFAKSADRMIVDFNKTVFNMDSLVNDMDVIPKDFGRVMGELSSELDELNLVFKALENHKLIKRSFERERKKEQELNGEKTSE